VYVSVPVWDSVANTSFCLSVSQSVSLPGGVMTVQVMDMVRGTTEGALLQKTEHNLHDFAVNVRLCLATYSSSTLGRVSARWAEYLVYQNHLVVMNFLQMFIYPTSVRSVFVQSGSI
jgi:hypothetical protein